jgi:hypothetical protein
MIRNPKNGYGSFEPTFSVLIGGPGGINEKRIGIGILYSYYFDEITPNHVEGIPVTFRLKMVLDQALDATRALAIINSNMTSGYNFIISDLDNAYAVEQTLNNSYYGKWNNPIESTHPFWAIKNVSRRTNIFINPNLAKVQRNHYDPSLFPLLMMILKLNPVGYKSIFSSSISWLHYKALSTELEKLWGNIALKNSMDMLRNIYGGRTDFRFFIIQKLGIYVPLHQWVACPETGDFLISFAGVNKNANENTIHTFNLFGLLNAKPP